jgi:4-hydroxy 2-oxovalerate aldolase
MIKLLDCTLRDGGYYNTWDFEPVLVQSYLEAMVALRVDYVEIGLRSLSNRDFKGGFAYSTDQFLQNLIIPSELANKIGVMLNASELISETTDLVENLKTLFKPKSTSPVSLVRIACHIHEFEQALPAARWLKDQGYTVGFNLMQIADRSDSEILSLAKKANAFPIDSLYFADSMGSLNPKQVKHIISIIRKGWDGDIGIHTHDNMGQALANSKAAVDAGAKWIDCTVTGMGRGPGNVQTEYLALALTQYRKNQGNITKLLEAIRKHFKPLQNQHNWGTNPYYYLAGQYGIHPSYVQEMLSDSRFNEEDILSVLEHLKVEGGKKYSSDKLDAARHFYSTDAKGTWNPKSLFERKDVLLLGAGPSVDKHKQAIKDYIQLNNPVVMALNTQSAIDQQLIDVRIACHPVRLLADCEAHVGLPQPLITPASMLPHDVISSLRHKTLLDYGLQVKENSFELHHNYCVTPSSLVIAYALATLSSGHVKHIFLAGFDGYGADDPRRKEVDKILYNYRQATHAVPITSLTPTLYEINSVSIYGIENQT